MITRTARGSKATRVALHDSMPSPECESNIVHCPEGQLMTTNNEKLDRV